MKYYSYDPDDGFRFHETEKEAKARADKNLELCRYAAQDGWPENMESICWGTVSECVVETMHEDRPKDRDLTEEEESLFGEWDYISDYELRATE